MKRRFTNAPGWRWHNWTVGYVMQYNPEWIYQFVDADYLVFDKKRNYGWRLMWGKTSRLSKRTIKGSQQMWRARRPGIERDLFSRGSFALTETRFKGPLSRWLVLLFYFKNVLNCYAVPLLMYRILLQIQQEYIK